MAILDGQHLDSVQARGPAFVIQKLFNPLAWKIPALAEFP
jgi:hypothetical protein